MGISTKNVDSPTPSGSSTSKKIEPGRQNLKITGVKLQPNKFKPGSDYLMLVVEGPAVGGGFEGFLIDKDDPSKGNHEGQVGWVKASEWAFMDSTIKSGKSAGTEIKRDDEILRYIKSLCVETGAEAWFAEQDGKHETIESFVEAFDKEKPYKDKFLRMCVCGRQYESKGYLNWDLYLPKWSKGNVPFENANVAESMSKVFTFDETKHIKKAAPVANFTPATNSGGGDLEL